ncbi:MAG: S-layer homology domain-containing protein, partial [Candidatus Gracilibacteria bacterium]|nr:S-layer homology domain-containing protein [Candidatus Gracilibacteria bacterium]
MKKILLSTVLTLAFLLPPVVHAASFSDIQEGSELEKMVEYLVDQGTVSGYPDGTFKLEKTINRAEALKIIFETIKVGLEENTDSGFPDVDPQQWYAKYVTSAKKKGIVLGYEDGYFRPEQEVNKAEFIKMALLALPFYERIPKKLSRINRSYHYEYIRPEQWYAEYVIAADKMGFIIPDMLPIRWFFPDEQMQRQDAIEIIYKIDKYVETNTLSINNPSIFFPEEAEGVINNYYEELNEELIQESYKSGNHGEDFNTFREKYLSDYQSNIFDHTFQGTMWSNIGGI